MKKLKIILYILTPLFLSYGCDNKNTKDNDVLKPDYDTVKYVLSVQDMKLNITTHYDSAIFCGKITRFEYHDTTYVTYKEPYNIVGYEVYATYEESYYNIVAIDRHLINYLDCNYNIIDQKFIKLLQDEKYNDFIKDNKPLHAKPIFILRFK